MAEDNRKTEKIHGKRSLPKSAVVKNTAIQLYAYEIKDKQVGNLLVKNSANAWWKERIKVEKLMDAFKIGCKVPEARVYAGISRIQYDYFVKNHPEFYAIKEACEEVLVLKARKKVADEIANNSAAAFAFLQKREAKQEQKEREEKPVKPNAVVFVDFGEPLPLELQEANNDNDHVEGE